MESYIYEQVILFRKKYLKNKTRTKRKKRNKNGPPHLVCVLRRAGQSSQLAPAQQHRQHHQPQGSRAASHDELSSPSHSLGYLLVQSGDLRAASRRDTGDNGVHDARRLWGAGFSAVGSPGQ